MRGTQVREGARAAGSFSGTLPPYACTGRADAHGSFGPRGGSGGARLELSGALAARRPCAYSSDRSRPCGLLSRARREPLLAYTWTVRNRLIASPWLAIGAATAIGVAVPVGVLNESRVLDREAARRRPSVFIDVFDDVSVQLQLGDVTAAGKSTPAAWNSVESEPVFTGLAQLL